MRASLGWDTRSLMTTLRVVAWRGGRVALVESSRKRKRPTPKMHRSLFCVCVCVSCLCGDVKRQWCQMLSHVPSLPSWTSAHNWIAFSSFSLLTYRRLSNRISKTLEPPHPDQTKKNDSKSAEHRKQATKHVDRYRRSTRIRQNNHRSIPHPSSRFHPPPTFIFLFVFDNNNNKDQHHRRSVERRPQRTHTVITTSAAATKQQNDAGLCDGSMESSFRHVGLEHGSGPRHLYQETVLFVCRGGRSDPVEVEAVE